MLKTPTTFLALFAAANLFISCTNSNKVAESFKPNTARDETRRGLYSSFKTIGEPYYGMAMIGTSSGSECILLEGGYLLEYSVHYRGFSVSDDKSMGGVKRSDNDSIYNLRINPHKGWTTKELDMMYRYPSREQVGVATPRKPSD
jgi:hypothetical protein